ncbi:MAG: TolC family protein, partial [Amphritea sp.]|nr:TolC family protein [Amphritea sp.]
SSSSLLNLLHNPIATLGSGIVLPFLEWQEMTLNKDISEVDYQLAVVDYRDTIYQAFEEVANLLTAKQHFDYQGDVYQAQHTNAQAIEAIYGSRYQQGESDIIDWISAMESRRSIETSLLENRYNQFVIQAKLYQSLGGGDIASEAEAVQTSR